MTVLIAKDKHDTYVIDATNRQKAVLYLFKLFDDNEYYTDLNGEVEQVGRIDKQKAWYASAKHGNAVDAERLLNHRKQRGYEYEDHWHFTDLIKP